MRSSVPRSSKPSRPPLQQWSPLKNPWVWGSLYTLLIGFAHCSEFDPNEKGYSGFGQLSSYLEMPFARRSLFEEKVPILSAQKTIEKLKQVTGEPTPTPAPSPTPIAVVPGGTLSHGTLAAGSLGIAPKTDAEAVSTFSLKKFLISFVDIAGFRQNWRLFQLPSPEVQGYAVRAYNREVKANTLVFEPSFTRCLDLDDRGQCEPRIGSRLEFEMLREMERRRSPIIYEAFANHWAAKSAAPSGRPKEEIFRRVELIVFRHAFKTSKDFTKRGSAQVLYSKDF